MSTAFARYRRPLVSLGILGPTSYFAYKYYNAPLPVSTFQISVRQRMADGKVERVPLTLPLLPLDEIERRLTLNETRASLPRGWRYTTSHVNSNEPIEDAHATAVVSRGDFGDKAGELLMFAVMDGHGGYWTSRLLSKTILPGVALELQTLNEAEPQKAPFGASGLLSYLRSFLPFYSASSSETTPTAPKTFASDPTYVQMAMKTAFAKLDSEIVNAPYRVLAPLLSNPGKLPIDLEKYPMALPTLLPALSGSCALVAMVDTAHDQLYVACTGDSRAVAGALDEQGRWKVDVLTEDQTGRNPTELKRCIAHNFRTNGRAYLRTGCNLNTPRTKWTTLSNEVAYLVVSSHRVPLGIAGTSGHENFRKSASLSVLSRSVEAHARTRLARLLEGTGQAIRRPPSSLRTPPYVTSEPVLTHRALSVSPTGDPALRFVVLATDGLWDELSSSEVVALVGAHLRGVRGTVPKAELAGSLAEGGNLGLDGKQIQRKPYAPGESWTFQDENISTHLIRNAVGGGDSFQLRKSLSIPAPHSRRFRDDITVTVVWWDDHDASVSASESARPAVRAKL